MSTQRLSKKSLAKRLVMVFVVIFVVVLVADTLLWFLGLGYYASFVSGAVAGAASVLLVLALDKGLQKQN